MKLFGKYVFFNQEWIINNVRLSRLCIKICFVYMYAGWSKITSTLKSGKHITITKIINKILIITLSEKLKILIKYIVNKKERVW